MRIRLRETRTTRSRASYLLLRVKSIDEEKDGEFESSRLSILVRLRGSTVERSRTRASGITFGSMVARANL